MDSHKKNYRLVIRIHQAIAFLIILGIIFVNNPFKQILSLILFIIVVSLLIQVFIYRARPMLYSNKKHGEIADEY